MRIMIEEKRIMGIDPSLVSTGWAVLSFEEVKLKNIFHPAKKSLFERYKPRLLDCGRIETNKSELDTQRIYKIYTELEKLIKFYKPEVMSIEDQYGYLNTKTLKQLSQVRGVCMALASLYGMNLYLYAPTSIKLIVTGNGKSKKEDMVNVINRYFDLNLNIKDNDKADAIAIALSYLIDRKKGTRI